MYSYYCRYTLRYMSQPLTSPDGRATDTSSPLVPRISPWRKPCSSSGTQHAFFASYGLVWSILFCSSDTNRYGVGSGSSPSCLTTRGMFVVSTDGNPKWQKDYTDKRIDVRFRVSHTLLFAVFTVLRHACIDKKKKNSHTTNVTNVLPS